MLEYMVEWEDRRMDMERLVKDFLGVGWKFPVEVDQATGYLKTSSYEEDIKEAIRIILMTRKGERVMRPEFGCGIQEYTFETMEDSVLLQMQMEVKNALIIWEPRITDVKVHIETDKIEEGKINISIDYVVRSTNNPYNLVYPYYINEGFKD